VSKTTAMRQILYEKRDPF